MARIRTIKPDFWTDEEIVELDPMDRLLFIGLWNFCDDQGYIDYRPKKLKMQIFPADDFDLPAAMERLRKSSLVDAYDAPTGVVAHIRNWSKHQRVNNPSKERYVAADLQERDTFDGPSTGLLSPNDSWSAEGKGREGKGSNTCASATAERESDDGFAEWYSHYPRKKGKGQAVKAYRAAVKKVSAERLLESLKAQIPSLMSKGAEYCPYPATWLNGESWDDEIEQPPTGKRPAPYPLPGTPEFATLPDEQKVRILEREQIREFNR